MTPTPHLRARGPRSPSARKDAASKPALAALAVLACFAASLAGCRKDEPREPETPQAAGEAWLSPQQMQANHVATARAAVHPVGEDLVTTGRITFDDLRVAHVFSPVTGRVAGIHVNPGQRVAKGAPLVTIDSPDLGSAIADLGKAQADLTAANHEQERQRALFEAHAGSQRDFETAQDNALKARAELQRARAKARMLRSGSVDSVTQQYVLRSPIAGEVIARNVNPGQEVQGQYAGGQAIEIFTIGSTDEVWVLGDLFEVDLPRVSQGANVQVSVVSYPDRTFQGRVDWISGSLDPVTRTAKVRCTIHNAGHELRPEMYATMGIAVPRKSALAIPRDAVVRLGDQTVVFVEAGRNESGLVKFARRVVRVDDSAGGDWLPVLAGLSDGDTVVTSGALLLSGTL